jgi:hypothetical protein
MIDSIMGRREFADSRYGTRVALKAGMSSFLFLLASAVSLNGDVNDAWRANVGDTIASSAPESEEVHPGIWSDAELAKKPVAGWAVTGLGGVTVLVGAGLGIASLVACAPQTATSSMCYGNRDFSVAAGVTAAIGLALVSAGVVLINVHSAKAQVALSPGGGTFIKTF